MGLIPEGKWSRLTLLWSFSQFIVITIIECIIIYMNLKNKKYYEGFINEYNKNLTTEECGTQCLTIGNFTALIVYQFLYIVALAYQLYLTVDTLLKFSTIDLIALAIFNSMCLVYSVTQNLQNVKFQNKFFEISDYKNYKPPNLEYINTTNFEYINMGIMLIFTIGWWYITFRLYKVFGWNVFKQIGADIRLKKRLKLFNILVILMKLDLFFIIFLFDIQYIALVIYKIGDNSKDDNINIENDTTNGTLWELATPIAIMIGIFIGIAAIMKKSRFYLGVYIFTLCATVGFMSHVLVDIYDKSKAKKYEDSKYSLTVTIAISLCMCMITYVVSLINFKNFGLGIPKSINKNSDQNGQSDNNKQKRLSID
ncbi:hypothetical protein BCR32DRAFT_248791 [Anaeromyces robustus]|uniref:Uncharacterized protein n=1 Tax=Anaeromyces robustus TaxID=1754192 RepID=A0A1Y1WSE5_9FUNG|nr:hypothetical protein BCR32DRAFT_248791 [Anaeromyces robustus]|eukprot:ORX76372.1 hypothetical protein BCR32DRAFT_248791 [Anaeromyces robustus]